MVVASTAVSDLMRQQQWQYLLLTVLASLFSGATAPAADPKWLEVTDRPAAMAAARKRAAQSASDVIRSEIDRVLAGDFLGADLDLLRANPDAARSKFVPSIRPGKVNERVLSPR